MAGLRGESPRGAAGAEVDLGTLWPSDGATPPGSRRDRPWRVLAVLVAIAAGVWFTTHFVGCYYVIGSSNPRPLRALRHDPMARYVPPAADRTISEREANAGSSLGMPDRAKLTRVFDLPASAAPGAMRDAVAAAQHAGWPIQTPDPSIPSSPGSLGLTSAQRSIGSGALSLFHLELSLRGYVPGETSPVPGWPVPARGHVWLTIEITES